MLEWEKAISINPPCHSWNYLSMGPLPVPHPFSQLPMAPCTALSLLEKSIYGRKFICRTIKQVFLKGSNCWQKAMSVLKRIIWDAQLWSARRCLVLTAAHSSLNIHPLRQGVRGKPLEHWLPDLLLWRHLQGKASRMFPSTLQQKPRSTHTKMSSRGMMWFKPSSIWKILWNRWLYTSVTTI